LLFLVDWRSGVCMTSAEINEAYRHLLDHGGEVTTIYVVPTQTPRVPRSPSPLHPLVQLDAEWQRQGDQGC
jgi:hypothetical protein